MNMDTFKSEVLRSDDTVTVNARQLQELLINYDSLKRQINSLKSDKSILIGSIEQLREELEECSNTHITLDLKV